MGSNIFNENMLHINTLPDVFSSFFGKQPNIFSFLLPTPSRDTHRKLFDGP